jgi:hypothetical protein
MHLPSTASRSSPQALESASFLLTLFRFAMLSTAGVKVPGRARLRCHGRDHVSPRLNGRRI